MVVLCYSKDVLTSTAHISHFHTSCFSILFVPRSRGKEYPSIEGYSLLNITQSQSLFIVSIPNAFSLSIMCVSCRVLFHFAVFLSIFHNPFFTQTRYTEGMSWSFCFKKRYIHPHIQGDDKYLYLSTTPH